VYWPSNDLVHPIVLWVVAKWYKVNMTATTTAGALMRDATKCQFYTATHHCPVDSYIALLWHGLHSSLVYKMPCVHHTPMLLLYECSVITVFLHGAN